MDRYSIPVKEVTSRKAVYRIAAELVEGNMRVEQRTDYRAGCCCVFGQIRAAVTYDHRLSWASRCKRAGMIDKAEADFRAQFEPVTGPLAHATYWMGSRSNAGMKRRITALLAAAEAL